MYLTTVYIPSSFATRVLTEVCNPFVSIWWFFNISSELSHIVLSLQVDKTKKQFENISFRKSVNLVIKQKIESISNVSEHVGFTCFSWFKISTHTGLTISFEFTVYLLLLVQTYYLYTLGFYAGNSSTPNTRPPRF